MRSVQYIKNVIGIVVLFTSLAVSAADLSLTKQQVNNLVQNVPAALSLKEKGGCPLVENLSMEPDLAMVQLSNSCSKSEDKMLTNYVVNIHSGKIWEDLSMETEVDSPHLQEIRQQLSDKVSPVAQ